MVTQASSATICSRTPDPNMVLSITAYGYPSTWSCMATWVFMDNDMSHSCHRTIDPNMAPAAAQSTDTRITSVVTWATDTGAGPWTQLCCSLIPQPPSPSPTTLQQQGPQTSPQTSWPQVEVQAMHINMASGGSNGPWDGNGSTRLHCILSAPFLHLSHPSIKNSFIAVALKTACHHCIVLPTQLYMQILIAMSHWSLSGPLISKAL